MESGEYCLPFLVGSGRGERVLTYWLSLPEPALEVLEWRRSVMVEKAEATQGGVVVSGHLCTRCLISIPIPVPEERMRAAWGREEWGRVLVRKISVPFVHHIAVPGADAGMQVTMTAAHVEADAPRPTWDHRAGLITGILDRTLVSLAVRVMQLVSVPVGDGKKRRQRKNGSLKGSSG